VSSEFKVAFVGYRDKCDGTERISYIDFTTDLSAVRSYILKQRATGGGDEAEDVIEGLKQGLNLHFTGGLLCSYLIGDAPCHGR
jgi:hypothetical protein